MPGDAKSLQTCIEIAAVSADEHYDAAMLVRDELRRLDPDLSKFTVDFDRKQSD